MLKTFFDDDHVDGYLWMLLINLFLWWWMLLINGFLWTFLINDECWWVLSHVIEYCYVIIMIDMFTNYWWKFIGINELYVVLMNFMWI